jgi:hypothetical protein
MLIDGMIRRELVFIFLDLHAFCFISLVFLAKHL